MQFRLCGIQFRFTGTLAHTVVSHYLELGHLEPLVVSNIFFPAQINFVYVEQALEITHWKRKMMKQN